MFGDVFFKKVRTFLVLGSWFLVPGSWFMVPGSWLLSDVTK